MMYSFTSACILSTIIIILLVGRLSREGSTASNFSYSTTQERLSNETEPPPGSPQ